MTKKWKQGGEVYLMHDGIMCMVEKTTQYTLYALREAKKKKSLKSLFLVCQMRDKNFHLWVVDLLSKTQTIEP